jgi:adenylate cyclase class IV
MSDDKKLDHIEFESKYRVEPSILLPFKLLVEAMPTFKEFVYAEGPDVYYVKKDLFLRYRKEANKGTNARAELTMKIKPAGAKNNIIREEFNIRVDSTPKETILKFVSALGFDYNFTVVKSCHIFTMEDATLVYYLVADTTDGTLRGQDCFVEIEVSEEQIHTMTEDQAWEILVKYEKMLESVGVSPQRRLRKSLFEMYEREVK